MRLRIPARRRGPGGHRGGRQAGAAEQLRGMPAACHVLPAGRAAGPVVTWPVPASELQVATARRHLREFPVWLDPAASRMTEVQLALLAWQQHDAARILDAALRQAQERER